MKRNFKFFIIAALLVTAPLLMPAQPPHPNNGGAPNGSNTKVGDEPIGAPIGSGTFILIMMAFAYGGHRYYVSRTAEDN